MKKSKAIPLSTTTHIHVIDESRTEVTRDRDTSDKWDGDDTHTDHDVIGFKISNGTYFDLIVDFEPKASTDYYLLYAVYSTGNSFSHSAGSGIEYYGLYTKEQLYIAEENKKILEDRSKKPEYNIEIKDTNGNMMKSWCPWSGYFESLDSVNLDVIRLLNGNET